MKVKRKVHANEPRAVKANVSRLELRDLRSPGRLTGDPRGALKSKSTW